MVTVPPKARSLMFFGGPIPLFTEYYRAFLRQGKPPFHRNCNFLAVWGFSGGESLLPHLYQTLFLGFPVWLFFYVSIA